jgi:hypothetical protein
MKLDINRLHPSLRPALNALVTANNALNPVVAARMRDNLLEANLTRSVLWPQRRGSTGRRGRRDLAARSGNSFRT